MKRDELLAIFDKTVAEARALLEKKNQDYADNDEVFGNLKLCDVLGLCSVQAGIVIRLSDKMRRLATATRRKLAVTDESAQDTAKDLINYSVLWIAAGIEAQKTKPSVMVAVTGGNV